MISGALEGTVCIDVSGHVAGPYAGSLLGDLGCDVLKVELPGGGEPTVDHQMVPETVQYHGIEATYKNGVLD